MSSPQLKTFLKNVRKAEDKPLDVKFNEWSAENPGIQVINSQFYPFNEINENNVVVNQYMCMSILFFRPSPD